MKSSPSFVEEGRFVFLLEEEIDTIVHLLAVNRYPTNAHTDVMNAAINAITNAPRIQAQVPKGYTPSANWLEAL